MNHVHHGAEPQGLNWQQMLFAHATVLHSNKFQSNFLSGSTVTMKKCNQSTPGESHFTVQFQ